MKNNELQIDSEGNQSAGDIVFRSISEAMDNAGVGGVFGNAMEIGEQLVIPAAEVVTAGGFGFGGAEIEENMTDYGGGGGGGYTFSRPVAVIVADPDGVVILNVIDKTKIALAALTTLGFMAATIMKFFRFRQ